MWVVFALAAITPLPALSGTWPEEVLPGASTAGWERARGHAFGRGGSRISYELLVDPKRSALYTITRYRLHGAGKDEPEDEVLIWNARYPPVDLRCYQRVRRPTVGSPTAWAWERVPTGTPSYRQLIGYAIEVYGINRAREIAEENARGD